MYVKKVIFKRIEIYVRCKFFNVLFFCTDFNNFLYRYVQLMFCYISHKIEFY